MTGPELAVVAAGWLAGWALAGRSRWLPPPPERGPGPTVSVVVPARDEADRLPRLLAALAAADPEPDEVLVVDDGSTDATAELARAGGATVLAAEPPAGWTGKAWACQRGADAARGEVLVFLDADTEPAPSAVAALAAAAVGSGGLVSAHPRHRVERPFELASAGPGLVSLLGAGLGGTPRRRWWRRPVAYGPAVAVSAAAYRSFGGHAAVRGEVAEDLALARAADAAGFPVRALLAGDLVRYRMYPQGWPSLVEGWSKNLAAGAGAIPPLRLAATVLWVTGALQAGVSLALAPAAGAAALYAAYAAQVAVLLRRIGRFGPLPAVAFPVTLAVFAGLFARSALLTLAGRPVPWRGRRVPVRP